jgi:hypothetical protein
MEICGGNEVNSHAFLDEVRDRLYVSVALPGEYSGFGGLVVSMLASGTQDRVFAPSRSLRKGSKAVCPMSQICGMIKNPIIYRGSRKL